MNNLTKLMKSNIKTMKAIVLSLVLAAVMLLPAGASAQDDSRHVRLFGLIGLFNSEEAEAGMLGLDESLLEEDGFPQNVQTKTGGGLFGFGKGFESDSRLFGNRGNAVNAHITGGLTFDNFGETPLGSGLIIMLGAGLGYVALKKKEDKQ